MAKRVALFVIWAAIGFVFSLGLLYLFTPFGLAGLLVVLPVIWVLEGRGLSKPPEIWGLLAGPGAFCLMMAANAYDDQGWLSLGVAAISLSLIGFGVSGRMRCARNA